MLRRPAHPPVVPATWLAAVLVGLLAAGCGQDNAEPGAAPAPVSPATAAASPAVSPTAAGTSVEVVVEGGEVVAGPGEVEVGLGEQVRLQVVSDRADELHVHGVDVTADVRADRPATVTFRAEVPGQFEVELEQAHLHLFDLVVR